MLKVSSKPFEGYTEYLKRKKENGAPPVREAAASFFDVNEKHSGNA